MNRYRFFSLCLGLICGLHLSAKDYYATDFGVKADGKTLNTSSIQKGIDFVNAQGGGGAWSLLRVIIRLGRFT